MDFICAPVHICGATETVHGHQSEKNMTGAHELSDVLVRLKTSLPFVVALPIIVALVFASIVDWLERRLTAHPETAAEGHRNDAGIVASRPLRWQSAHRRGSLKSVGHHGHQA
jgi:hypothetical protein